MTRIKICGITNLEDALLASELGADVLGFVFAKSPRRIEPEQVKDIISALPPFIGRVGVFVNERPEVIERIFSFCNLSAVQLHGDEGPEYVKSLSIPAIKAFRVRDVTSLEQIRTFEPSFFLLDAYDAGQRGGTGLTFDWNIARQASDIGHLILSGGLNSDNVKSALDQVHPYAVDVSSGVEDRPGKKDKRKLTQFIQEVKTWDNRTN